MNQDVGNLTESYKTEWGNCEILAKKQQFLEWVSLIASWEQHRAVCECRVEAVRQWLRRTNWFAKGYSSEYQVVNPVPFSRENLGVGKRYLKFVVLVLLR